jgi:transposase, IS5 family
VSESSSFVVQRRSLISLGADSHSGLVHSASMSAGNVHESHELPNLLRGEETRQYGDSTYRGQKQREPLKRIAPKAKDVTNKLTLAILVRD